MQLNTKGRLLSWHYFLLLSIWVTCVIELRGSWYNFSKNRSEKLASREWLSPSVLSMLLLKMKWHWFSKATGSLHWHFRGGEKKKSGEEIERLKKKKYPHLHSFALGLSFAIGGISQFPGSPKPTRLTSPRNSLAFFSSRPRACTYSYRVRACPWVRVASIFFIHRPFALESHRVRTRQRRPPPRRSRSCARVRLFH